ncbi:MAG: response regulator, partial [Phycisphaerales bacterium]
MRALIVDDSKASRSILAKGLRELRFECAEAAHGAEALELLSAGPPPDLVTVNRHMPVMDGVTLVSRMRADAALRRIKTLMVSTDGGKEGVAAALAAGADDFLAKPFTQEALARKLVALGVCTEDVAGAAATRPIRVLIVDDSATIRGILSSTLAADPDLQVAGTAVNGQAALAAIASAPPDLVLLDVE